MRVDDASAEVSPWRIERIIIFHALVSIMEMAPECIPCLLNRVLYQTDLCAPKRSRTAMEDSLKILSEGFHPGVNSAKLATRVHAHAYQVIGCSDPYRELKDRSNEVARSLVPLAMELIDSSKDRLRAAAICAIAGNVMDFGIGSGIDEPEELTGEFRSLFDQGLDIDDLPKMREILERADEVVLLLDNCGEVVFDKLLVKELRSYGVKVTGVVKGEPILTDVTEQDLRSTGTIEVLDDVSSTGAFAVGLDIERMGDKLRRDLEGADLIVSKGMANFESLSDERFRPIAFLLRAKCSPVANAIGARKDDNMLKVLDK